MRISLLALALFATAGTASAEATLSIPLKSGTMDSVESITYTCGDNEPLSVQYVNAGANALALIQIDGEERIFVNVVSGSGARYASGADIWSTKGDSATLENEMKENGNKECQAQETPAAQ